MTNHRGQCHLPMLQRGTLLDVSWLNSKCQQLYSVARKRDEDLTIIEDMEQGPYEHKPPIDDANFERLEPHSGIRLLYVFLHGPVPVTLINLLYLCSLRIRFSVQITLDIARRYLRVPAWALLPFTPKTIFLHKAER